MINGIGVLGWGVGGLEAESVLFGGTPPRAAGMPVMLRVPEVIGVRLTGRLGHGASRDRSRPRRHRAAAEVRPRPGGASSSSSVPALPRSRLENGR